MTQPNRALPFRNPCEGTRQEHSRLHTLLPVLRRYGLQMGARLSWLVRGLMLLFAPLAWPAGKLLDWVLGSEDAVAFRCASGLASHDGGAAQKLWLSWRRLGRVYDAWCSVRPADPLVSVPLLFPLAPAGAPSSRPWWTCMAQRAGWAVP